MTWKYGRIIIKESAWGVLCSLIVKHSFRGPLRFLKVQLEYVGNRNPLVPEIDTTLLRGGSKIRYDVFLALKLKTSLITTVNVDLAKTLNRSIAPHPYAISPG